MQINRRRLLVVLPIVLAGLALGALIGLLVTINIVF